MESERRKFGMILTFAVLFTTLTFIGVGCASASSITICSSGCNYTSIQAAIDAADPGDTIEVHSDVYNENVNVTKQLILKGIDTGSGKPVVDAGGSGSAITLSADGITLEGFTATNAGSRAVGIMITSNNNTITGNIATNNIVIGIYLMDSNNNVVTGNTVSNNKDDGIGIGHSSNNTITGNNVSNNVGTGIYLYPSTSNNVITGNNASNNGGMGICLSFSSNNVITDNYVSNNKYDGISLSDSNNNIITGNTASNNKEDGISLLGSSSKVYSNNFITNTENVLPTGWGIWNSAEKITYIYDSSQYTNFLGNYWDDYEGEDANGDGIGDTPYFIYRDRNTKDNYPLMEPWENYFAHAPIAPTPTPEEGVPGFEAVFAIAGLLVVAYLSRRK